MKKNFVPITILFLMLLHSFPIHAGQWVKDKNTGCQIFTMRSDTNRITWSGECVNEKAHGKGIVKFFQDSSQTARYEGEYKEGKPRKGVLIGTDGSRVEGNWNDNMPEIGVSISSDGERFEGKFKDSQKGILIKTDGTRFEGEFKNGDFYKGVVTESNGLRIEGEFNEADKILKGNVTGGFLLNFNGELKGDFEGDSFLLTGTIMSHSGQMTGLFEVNSKNTAGLGILIRSDGTRYGGLLDNNGMIGKGILFMPDNSFYEGEFQNNMPNGIGVITDSFGNSTGGRFVNGDLETEAVSEEDILFVKGLLEEAREIVRKAERAAQMADNMVISVQNIPEYARKAAADAISLAADAKKIAGEARQIAVEANQIVTPSIPPTVSVKVESDVPVSSPGIAKRWAVIIGISEYQDTRIPSLRYAAKDAEKFYDWIVSSEGGRYSPANVSLLINENAKSEHIRNAIYEWLSHAIEEDIVTIYFAGHGSPESPDSDKNLFLLPYDTRYDNIRTTGFPMWDIETALKRYIKAKKVIVIADACHSGGIGEAFIGNRTIKRNNRVSEGLQNLSEIGNGICVISASSENQLSKESQTWGNGHGVFTYFLLDGLKGKADYNQDKRITLGELIPYLSEQVRRETKNAQTPIVAGRYDPELSIGSKP